ncbi:TRAM domain-containing protein (plasmid) [Haladaptatus sp. SPP-AMP-3]|uniref:TRAM domain-containing protein n=1 Tax=Haladaptatus sp. SPP-AMP-3 TaxID=3121295 RepID=UPI003C30470B
MELPEELRCLFTGEIETEDGSYTLTVPSQEIVDGDIQPDTAYRVVILKQPSLTESTTQETTSTTPNEQTQDEHPNHSPAPVEEGDRRTVKIEGVGEKGDGIARIDNGYVLIVPDTEQRDRVTVEINNVKPNVAFAEVVEHKAYYE